MRIDKYLKVSRLIKRRTVANEVADAGRILVNGKPAAYEENVVLIGADECYEARCRRHHEVLSIQEQKKGGDRQ